MGAAASCPTFDFDGANISIYFYKFQIFREKITKFVSLADSIFTQIKTI